jgi:hypothetical protein
MIVSPPSRHPRICDERRRGRKGERKKMRGVAFIECEPYYLDSVVCLCLQQPAATRGTNDEDEGR